MEKVRFFFFRFSGLEVIWGFSIGGFIAFGNEGRVFREGFLLFLRMLKNSLGGLGGGIESGFFLSVVREIMLGVGVRVVVVLEGVFLVGLRVI